MSKEHKLDNDKIITSKFVGGSVKQRKYFKNIITLKLKLVL